MTKIKHFLQNGIKHTDQVKYAASKICFKHFQGSLRETSKITVLLHFTKLNTLFL